MRNPYSAFFGIATVTLAALCLGACRTGEMTLSGEFKAQLFDNASHQPVAGAVVTVWSDNNPSVNAQQTSDEKGLVSLAALRGSAPSSFPLEYGFTASARVEAPGYRPVILRSSLDRAYFQYPNRNGPPAEMLLSRD